MLGFSRQLCLLNETPLILQDRDLLQQGHLKMLLCGCCMSTHATCSETLSFCTCP